MESTKKNTRITTAEELPNYWIDHLDDKIERINHLEQQGPSMHSFAFITDMHMPTNEMHSFALLKEIIEQTGVNLIINGGDAVSNNAETTKQEAIQQIREMLQGFGKHTKIMMNTMANHDDNTITKQWKESLDEEILYSELFQYMGDHSVYGESGKYHYRDNPAQQTRYIILDSIDIPYKQAGDDLVYRGQWDYAFRQEQLDWFAHVALNTPSAEWSVIVVSHIQPYEEGVLGIDFPIINAELARGILAAYRDQTVFDGESQADVHEDFQASVSVDYTQENSGGNVIAWLAGHVHYDNLVKMPEGIHLITSLCDTNTSWTEQAPRRISGTASEHAFDIATVDRKNRKLYLTRVGAGADRVIDY